MEFRPIQPGSTNKVNSTVSLANDGGSKSNSGYINKRDKKKEEKIKDPKLDEVTLSTSSASEEPDMEEELSIWKSICKFFGKIRKAIFRMLGISTIKVENIFKDA